jgi:hypothetical protein
LRWNDARETPEKWKKPVVSRASYDSKASLCSLELDPGVKEGGAVAEAILEAATQAIGQFLWFDTVQHGDDVLKM